jgi:hypothetical protein
MRGDMKQTYNGIILLFHSLSDKFQSNMKILHNFIAIYRSLRRKTIPENYILNVSALCFVI